MCNRLCIWRQKGGCARQHYKLSQNRSKAHRPWRFRDKWFWLQNSSSGLALASICIICVCTTTTTEAFAGLFCNRRQLAKMLIYLRSKLVSVPLAKVGQLASPTYDGQPCRGCNRIDWRSLNWCSCCCWWRWKSTLWFWILDFVLRWNCCLSLCYCMKWA